MKRRAFTLIELMVVVGIIAVLSTLLIVGIGKLQTNAKRQQTTQILGNCQAMWTEFDAVKRLHFDQFAINAPGNVTLEAETAVEQNTPGTVGERLSFAVQLTRAVFAQMRSLPNIRSGMDKLASGKMLATASSTSSNSVPPFGTSFGFSSMTRYAVGKQVTYVTYTDPTTPFTEEYYCIHTPVQNSDGSYTPQYTPPPPDSGYWFPLCGIVGGVAKMDPTDPVLLDAWGNPIIFVIGSQLGSGKTLNADGTIPAGKGIVKAGGRSVVVSSPDHRVFWASAGPDGDFSKGDDNIYSFER